MNIIHKIKILGVFYALDLTMGRTAFLRI